MTILFSYQHNAEFYLFKRKSEFVFLKLCFITAVQPGSFASPMIYFFRPCQTCIWLHQERYFYLNKKQKTEIKCYAARFFFDATYISLKIEFILHHLFRKCQHVSTNSF